MNKTAKELLLEERAQLERRIAEVDQIRARLKHVIAAIAELDKASDVPPEESSNLEVHDFRFANMPPIRAILKYFGEQPDPSDWKPVTEVIEALKKGGATYGKKRGDTNLRTAITINTEVGSLEQKGDRIRVAPAKPPKKKK